MPPRWTGITLALALGALVPAALLTSDGLDHAPWPPDGSTQPVLEWRSQVGGATHGVALRGHTVLVGLGARVLAFDATDRDAPLEIGQSPLFDGVVEDIQVVGVLAWVALGDAGIVALDVGSPNDLKVVGAYDTPGHGLSLDVGRTDVALLADSDHLLALDLRDPAAVRELGRWAAPTRAVHVTRRGDIAFLTDEHRGLHALDVGNPASMQLLDVFDELGPDRASVAFGTTLYVNAGQGIHVVDARDPRRLVAVGRLDPGEDRSYARADLVIAKRGLLAAGRLYDLSDPWAPRRISGSAQDARDQDIVRGEVVATDGDLVVAARGSDQGGFILGDVSDPQTPRRRGGLRTLGGLRGLGAERLSVLPDERALQLGSLRIDVSDADHPRIAGESDRLPGSVPLDQAWGIGHVGFDASNQLAPFELIALRPPLRSVPVPALSGGEVWDMQGATLLGDTAWIAGAMLSRGRIQAFRCPIVAALDLSDLERPRWAGSLDSTEDLPAEISHIAADAASSTVVLGHGPMSCDGFLAEGSGALTIVDAKNPEHPAVIEHLTMQAPVRDLAAWQGAAYVAADHGGLRVIGLTGPGAPREIAALDDGDERALELELAWPHLWLGYDRHLSLIDIREPARPRELRRQRVPSEIVAMTIDQGMLWVATAEAGWLGYRTGPIASE